VVAEFRHGIYPGDVVNGVWVLESAMVYDTLSFIQSWDGVKGVNFFSLLLG
jgi:hypothetical protein